MTKRSVPVIPHNIIQFNGEDWIEVEWPADGRYDIGYQLAQETERPGMGRYMGLFELASRKKIKDAPSAAGEPSKEKK